MTETALAKVSRQITEDLPLDEAAVAELCDEHRTVRDLLRDHVDDWGRCDHPADCECSDARARRHLGMLDIEANLSPGGPCEVFR